MMAKTTTAVCLKRSCAQQRTVRKLFKGAFACQRPQLYTNQISRRSMQRQPRLSRDKNADGQTDRQTDGQTAFQLYIVDYDIFYLSFLTCSLEAFLH